MINQFVRFLQSLVGADSIEEIIFDRLLPEEKIIMIDGPASIAFVFNRVKSELALLACLVIAYFSTSTGLTAIVTAVAAILVLSLMYGAIKLHYVRYVVTTSRIIYLSGVLQRSHQWIPWAKVTDLSYKQTLADRTQNIGRVRIESANEASPFSEMKDLSHPETMMRVLVYMVSQRQGSVVIPNDIHARIGIESPDGILHMPDDDDEDDGGDDDGTGDDDDGGGDSGGGDGDGDGDATTQMPRPQHPRSAGAGGPLPPGTVTVPRPTQGEESVPSRAQPVHTVGERPPRVRPDPPASRNPGPSPTSGDRPPSGRSTRSSDHRGSGNGNGGDPWLNHDDPSLD